MSLLSWRSVAAPVVVAVGLLVPASAFAGTPTVSHVTAPTATTYAMDTSGQTSPAPAQHVNFTGTTDGTTDLDVVCEYMDDTGTTVASKLGTVTPAAGAWSFDFNVNSGAAPLNPCIVRAIPNGTA